MAELLKQQTVPAWRFRVSEILERFKQLPNNKKMLFLLALAVVFSIAASLVMDRTSSYKVLFNQVEDRDGGQIIAALQQMNIPYRLDAGGMISVPSERVYDARLKLAAQGLPKSGGVGFELMDSQKFGISQFAEQVNYQRAIEGELARTIQAIDAVEEARVHIAVPKQTVFVREQALPTASVMLSLFRGRVLDAGQVAGIVHLVSSSVPHLSIKNVTVVDQNGNLLSNAGAEGNGAGLDQRQLSYVKELEQGYVKRIEAILEPVFGFGNIRAQVTASVDFSETEQTSETYKPNSSPNTSTTRSQQISEQLTNPTAGPAGVPGALSNQPPSAASAPIALPLNVQGDSALAVNPLAARKDTVSRDITTNYEVDKTIQHTRLPKGEIKRLSAAVVVNYRNMPDKKGGVKSTPLESKEIDQVNNLVKEAIGFNSKRGDSLNVVNAPFAHADIPDSLPDKLMSYAEREGITIAKYALLTLALLYLLLGVIRPVMRELLRAGLTSGVLPVATEQGKAVGSLLNVTDEGGTHRQAAHTASPGGDLNAAKNRVKNDPRMAAQVIKEWISADE